MNKTAIKNYAIWARVQLIESAKQRAYEYEITENGENNPNLEAIGGRLLSKIEKEQRQQLINQIRQKGYTQVMEEAAYTWFNRFIALRFMEVNGYLPSKVRVFTDENNAFKPEIMKEAMSIELDGLNRQLVLELIDKQDNETLYKTLLIAQCNALNTPLPYMFERISNWTELLFPANLLRRDSVIGTMISSIPEEDWTEAVQIIGWLYQYYNSELKDETFALLKKNVKITKERIPAATQLFTPDWIVRYMVENSLGRLWYEGHRDFDKSAWKYYLDEAEQEPEVERKLQTIRAEYTQIKPEDIKVIDPCMGSGHILCYLFDVLVQIYEAYGYSTREAAQSIVENNLYGLDIDDRAAQLAYFAVMMKARQYDRRFFTRGIQPHVMAIQESNTLEAFDHLQEQLSLDTLCLETANQLIRTFRDAKEYGSILDVEIPGLDHADRLMEQLRTINGNFELMAWIAEAEELLPALAKQAAIMQQKYDVVVTNPPYMGASNMNSRLNDFIKQAYGDYKSDFFSSFIVRSTQMAKREGYLGFFTPYVWMFIQSYEKLRQFLYTQATIETLIQFEYSAFEEATVPVCTFAFRNSPITAKKGCYLRLTDFRGGMEIQRQKTLEAISNHACGFYFEQSSENFSKIPGAPVAYWVNKRLYDDFDIGSQLGDIAPTKKGLDTGKNDVFLRLWYEVDESRFGRNYQTSDEFAKAKMKWAPHDKGGDFRRWYGNKEWVINWENDGYALRHSKANLRSEQYYFHRAITWSSLTSGHINFRLSDYGAISNTAGSSIYPDKNDLYLIGVLNSKVTQALIDIINPTINYSSGPVSLIPIIYNETEGSNVGIIVRSCIDLARVDWDSFESSWDFQHHPLVGRDVSTVARAYALWEAECRERFNHLKDNEEELNRIFIDLYGLQDELTPEVEDKDVTVRRADLGRDIRSFISYAVGCMFGRYSLYVPGLLYAGGTWNDEAIRQQIWDGFGKHFASHDPMGDYEDLMPDRDGILPICDDEYFGDDIVGRFVQFVETVWGKDTLEENLRFIAKALGGNGTPRQVIRSYFLNDFYADHLKIYQRRPIYWLFSSGKKNGFKCLIYMHRYQPDLLARIRTDYVHEQQERYRTQLTLLEDSQQTAGASERVKLNKQITKIKDQALELQKYEEKIHHLADQMISIDLDDGVKVNYAKFQDVLEKIK